MNGELWKLAVQAMAARKRSTLLMLLVLSLSITLAIVTLSVAESIAKTNEIYRLDSYGEWYLGNISGWPEDEAVIREGDWADRLGIAKCYGLIQSSLGNSGIGTVNDEYLSLARIHMEDGRLPESPGEIAMEGGLLVALGYDGTIGQEITLPVTFQCTPAQITTVTAERTFVLTGVIREYSKLWRLQYNQQKRVLNAAFILEEDAEALLADAAGQVEKIRLTAQEQIKTARENGDAPNMFIEAQSKLEVERPNYQYFFTVREGMERRAKEQLQVHLVKSRFSTNADRIPSINKAAEVPEQTAAVNYIYTVLIFAVTLLAVFCIYTIQMQKQVRQITLFRSIGITKRQLRVMMFYETICICIPAMLVGIASGAACTWALLRLAVYSGSVPVYVVIPINLLIPALLIWALSVLLSRLMVFQVALRGRLVGRVSLDARKARRFQRLQRVTTASLSVLLCACVFFSSLEAACWITQIKEWGETPSYQLRDNNYDVDLYSEATEEPVVLYLHDIKGRIEYWAQGCARNYTRTLREQAQTPEEKAELAEKLETDPMAKSDFWFDLFTTNYTLGLKQITEETLQELRNVPGVTSVTAVEYLSAKWTADGVEENEYYRQACEASQIRARCDLKLTGNRSGFIDGVEAHILMVPEAEWADYFDTSLVDLEAFRRGDQVVQIQPVNDKGQIRLKYPIVTDEEKGLYHLENRFFDEAPYQTGDTITLQFYESKSTRTGLRVHSLDTVNAEVRVAKRPLELIEDNLEYWMGDPCCLICSVGFVERVLKSLPPFYPIAGTYVTGSNHAGLGFRSAFIYTDLNAGYLAADAMITTMVDEIEGDVDLKNSMQEHTADGQDLQQNLLLVLLAGSCVAIVLILIITNTLTVETERERRRYGILQSLGMSRRQLVAKLMKTALFRGLLGAVVGWGLYAGYIAYRAAQLQVSVPSEWGEMVPITLSYAEKLRRVLNDYVSSGITLWTVALLTLLGIALVLGISMLSKRRLFSEDLMKKLREEQ